MKILVISANYTPYHFGGYELRIKDIVDGLVQRGHQVRVLTTRKSKKRMVNSMPLPYVVFRNLHNRHKANFFPKEILIDLLDTKCMEKLIKAFNPDVIYLGHIYILSKAIMPYIAMGDVPIVFDEGGNGLKGDWTEHGRWFRFTGDYESPIKFLNKIKPTVIKIICKISKGRIQATWTWPKNMKVFINSELNKKNAKTFGVPINDAAVIYSGVDMGKFSFRPRKALSRPIRIIIPGRVEIKKGQLDGIKLAQALENHGIDVEIIIVGSRSTDGYYDALVSEIEITQLNEKIKLFPMVDRPELIDHYHQSDICFFPSYHQSGFSRIPLESMACGCIVISYGNEGSNEVIRHGENGFLVHFEDYPAIVQVIQELISNPSKFKKIILQARKDVESSYSMPVYVDQIENFILSAVNVSK